METNVGFYSKEKEYIEKLNIDLVHFFEEHKKKLFFSALVMLGDRHKAEDAVQEVFLLAYKFLQKNQIDFNKAWLSKIMLNHCKQILKKEMIKVVELESIDEKVTKDSNFELLSTDEIVLWEIINKLDLHERTVIILRYVYDLKVSDISKIIKIKEGTVKSQISRTLSKVREMLKEE